MNKQKKKPWEFSTFDDHNDQEWCKEQASKVGSSVARVKSSSTGSMNSSTKTATTANSAVCGSRVTGSGCRRARMRKKGWAWAY